MDDVATTANYYRDKLGFQYERFWGEPPCFCMVYRNVIVIMLRQVSAKGVMRPNHIADPESDADWDAYIWVDDADALYGEFTAKGVKITRGICDQPYGCRDFDVEDCNGYRLCTSMATAPPPLVCIKSVAELVVIEDALGRADIAGHPVIGPERTLQAGNGNEPVFRLGDLLLG